MTHPSPDRSLRGSLRRLRSAYLNGDAAALHAVYVDVARTSRWLGAGLILIERMVPVRRMLAHAASLEASMATYGLHEGCARYFDELGIAWQCALPPSVRQIAETAPVVFFGNHPSLFTPFLTAASVDRSDLRFFSTKYVCHLLPSIGRTAFPMEVPLTRSWTEWRRGGWQRVLVYRLISLLHDMPAPAEIRAANRASLVAGAEHVRRGGSAIICPGGGGKRKDRRWYTGIGSLIKELQQTPSSRPVYLLPFHEENCSNRRIYAHIQRGPISRLKNALWYRRPILIRFGDPIPLAEIGTAEFSPQQLVEWLKARYESLFAEPAWEPS